MPAKRSTYSLTAASLNSPTVVIRRVINHATVVDARTTGEIRTGRWHATSLTQLRLDE